MKSYLFLFISIFTSTLVSAQIEQDYSLFENLRLSGAGDIKKGITYEGTPFLTGQKNGCKLILEDKTEYDNVSLRYNIYDDELEFEKKEQFYKVPKDKLFAEFYIDDHHFRYFWNFKDKKYKPGYLEILVKKDKIYLLKKHHVDLIEATKEEPYKEAKPAQFIPRKPLYFIGFNNEPLKEFKSEKELYELIPEHSIMLKEHIKKNKLKFRNEEDIVSTIVYLNSIYNK